MQRYAEESVREHMAQLQEKLYDNWKKRTAPWDRDYVLKSAMQRSGRYKALQAKGLSEEAIMEVFNTPVTMTVFSWEKGEIEREMTPLDSVRYYLSLLNTGFLAAEPGTGLVRAWVGGIDHKYFQYDHVKSTRQVGSTFKPIVYAAALENGMLPCEYTPNELVTYSEYDDWQPRNANGEYGGVYSMEGALSQSVNSVSVDIIMRTGAKQVRDLAKLMGIKGYVPEEPSIALGTPDASLYEMIQVYGTFANRGRKPTLHYLDRIETADGEVLVQFRRPNPSRFPQVLSTARTDMMVKMMQAVVDSGTARRLRYRYGLRNDIAGKTGTTQNNSDGWFIGFTPKIVAGVWVGAETPQVHFRSTSLGQGGYSALPIWGSFMRKVYRDKELRDWRYGKFTPPADSILALMDCPHFLPEMPIFVNDYGVPDTSSFFQRLFNSFRRQRYEEYYQEANWQEMPQRREGESDRRYERRIREWLREENSEQRREERKNMWSKILFDKQRKKGKKDHDHEHQRGGHH
jgi:penicillin-binding protein 1A